MYMILQISKFTCKLVGTRYSIGLSPAPTLNFRFENKEKAFPLEPVSSHRSEAENRIEFVLFLKVAKENRSDAKAFKIPNFYKATFEIDGRFINEVPNSKFDFIFCSSEWPTLKALDEFSDQTLFDDARASYEIAQPV